MLVEFYAREIVAQQQADAACQQTQQASHGSDGMYMRNPVPPPAAVQRMVTPP